MLIVVCYDIADNGRRTRLHKTLEAYGRAVQRSVFECDIRPQDFERLRRKVHRLTRPDDDQVRYYVLCEACVKRIDVKGGPPVQRAPAYYLV